MLDSHERLINLEEKIKREKEIFMDHFHYMVINGQTDKPVPWYKIPGKIFYFALLPIIDPVHYKIIMKTLERIKTTNPGIHKDDPPQN